MMLAVILAAGRGTRLGGRAKALFDLDGTTLLDRCAESLSRAGTFELTIVTGHDAASVERSWGACERPMAADFLHNPLYAELNNFYTLALACERCRPGPLLAVNSDIVFMPQVIEDITTAGGDLGLAVEPGATDDEALKVAVTGGRAVALGKALPPASAHGEFIGVSLLSDRGRATYMKEASAARSAGETDLYYEDIFSRICGGLDTRLTDVARDSWAEIDELADVPRASAVGARQQLGQATD
jgi:choline kinase